jgi:hypothetical protein
MFVICMSFFCDQTREWRCCYYRQLGGKHIDCNYDGCGRMDTEGQTKKADGQYYCPGHWLAKQDVPCLCQDCTYALAVTAAGSTPQNFGGQGGGGGGGATMSASAGPSWAAVRQAGQGRHLSSGSFFCFQTNKWRCCYHRQLGGKYIDCNYDGCRRMDTEGQTKKADGQYYCPGHWLAKQDFACLCHDCTRALAVTAAGSAPQNFGGQGGGGGGGATRSASAGPSWAAVRQAGQGSPFVIGQGQRAGRAAGSSTNRAQPGGRFKHGDVVHACGHLPIGVYCCDVCGVRPTESVAKWGLPPVPPV